MLPLGRLLQLVPRFTAWLKTTFTEPNPEPALTFFSNPEERPAVVDTSNPAITMIVKGKEIAETIIDGGLGVNVINKMTCGALGIRDWESCPLLPVPWGEHLRYVCGYQDQGKCYVKTCGRRHREGRITERRHEQDLDRPV